MRGRLATWKRLATLYAVVEEIQSAELQRMTAAVRAAEQAIGAQQHVVQSARVDGRDALILGDRVGWTMSETMRETATRKKRRLEDVRLEREVLSDVARDQYVASRIKYEQVKRVADHLAEQIEIDEGRRMQAASDDRFLARRRWTDTQDGIARTPK